MTSHNLDWLAARLLVETYDINQEYRRRRNTDRLESLYQEAMKFRITEPTFFQGSDRRVGDILDFPTGPVTYKRALNGKMEPVPQYVELPHEILVSDMAPSIAATITAPAIQATPLAQNKFNEPNPMSVTGATSLKAKFEAARARKAAIEARVETALTTYNGAADMAESAIKSLEDDATALQAEVAGFTNGAPE